MISEGRSIRQRTLTWRRKLRLAEGAQDERVAKGLCSLGKNDWVAANTETQARPGPPVGNKLCDTQQVIPYSPAERPEPFINVRSPSITFF